MEYGQADDHTHTHTHTLPVRQTLKYYITLNF